MMTGVPGKGSGRGPEGAGNRRGLWGACWGSGEEPEANVGLVTWMLLFPGAMGQPGMV